MRVATTTIFNEFLPSGTTSSMPAFTGTQFNDELGHDDALALQVVLDHITPHAGASGNLYLFIEHSVDGVHWIERNDQSNGFSGASADVTIVIPNPVTIPTLMAVWSDACQGLSETGPLLGLVRARVFFDQSDISGHVQIFATRRRL